MFLAYIRRFASFININVLFQIQIRDLNTDKIARLLKVLVSEFVSIIVTLQNYFYSYNETLKTNSCYVPELCATAFDISHWWSSYHTHMKKIWETQFCCRFLHSARSAQLIFLIWIQHGSKVWQSLGDVNIWTWKQFQYFVTKSEMNFQHILKAQLVMLSSLLKFFVFSFKVLLIISIYFPAYWYRLLLYLSVFLDTCKVDCTVLQMQSCWRCWKSNVHLKDIIIC